MNVIKKVVFIALMIWLLLTVSAYANTATVNTEAVRMRREATTDSEVITIIQNNQEVTLIEQQGQWYKVQYNEYTGFIREDLLNITEPINTQEPENVEQPEQQEPEVVEEENNNNNENIIIEKVVKETTTLRAVPNIMASKIDEIALGTVVTVIQVKNNWTCIEFNGKSAWLPNNALEDKTQEQVSTQEGQTPQEVIKIMYINVSSANIRAEATTSSEVLMTKTKNQTVEVLEDVGEWYKIKIEDQNHAGYISKPLVSDESDTTSRSIEEPRQDAVSEENTQQPVEETVIKSVYVNVAKANLRSGSATTSNIVSSANRKDKLDVIGEENGWYKIKTSSGNAYIRKDLVVDSLEEVSIPVTPTVTNNQTTVVGNTATATGSAVVAYAKQFSGYRYVYGGAGPSSFDCSGFTQYVYKNFGIYLSHSAVAQASNGVSVDKANLQLGDLIIFRDWDNKSIGHCGIYIGNSQFIHAANPSRGVVTDTFASGYYYERYVSARRLF